MTDEQFGDLIRTYEHLVFTICYQMVRDYHEAQNLAQDTFVAAYAHIDGCKTDNLKGWLGRIAVNKAKDYLKSAYNRRITVDSDTVEAAPVITLHTPESLAMESEGAQQIREKIHTLKEPYKSVSILYFIEEQNPEEIAKRLGRPKKTVQTQIYRSKVMMQNMLKGEYR